MNTHKGSALFAYANIFKSQSPGTTIGDVTLSDCVEKEPIKCSDVSPVSKLLVMYVCGIPLGVDNSSPDTSGAV
jgi:hypothetical protein